MLKVGRYTLIRHWWRWYTIHQVMPDGKPYLRRIEFPFKEEE